MSIKRSRANYEADLQAQQSPYALYGTPLPPLDSESRDDGSYVPVWKQEVTDERGRKRLHGAFTGGFSAGYFNTVGSKEGWTPSTFVSSRANRKKDEKVSMQQRPEDFMDEEDLAEEAEAQLIQTDAGYAGLGSTEDETSRRGALIDLFRMDGETMGVKLLKKMGWREGQGVGPKVQRKARLDVMHKEGLGTGEEMHWFAPENTSMISFVKKSDHKGLGFDGETKLEKIAIKSDNEAQEEENFGTVIRTKEQKPKKAARGGIGIGILNDTGSDDEDPYEIGPRISYNKVIGGDKKKKNPRSNSAIRPIFISKKSATVKALIGFRKCHDGRLPLDGFVLGREPESSSSSMATDGKYPPPEIPEGWTSSKIKGSDGKPLTYLSTSEAAKASKMDPKARAAVLGEAALPGKSVFDFLSKDARDRLAAASGKSNLPAALGEIPEGYSSTPAERQKELFSRIPKVDSDTAMAALSRGASGFMPYAEDEGKRSRYRSYLEHQAGILSNLATQAPGISTSDWLKELQEFASCAQIFKPMTGMMATRFTSSSAPSTLKPSSDSTSTNTESLLSKPTPKAEDPAEVAAKMGMFGPLTRTSQDFYPTRLLCRRFNVKPPAHVHLDPERAAEDGGGVDTGNGQQGRDLELVSKSTVDDMMKEHWDNANSKRGIASAAIVPAAPVEVNRRIEVDVERNDALEGKRPPEDVFRSIFGDSDDDE